MDASGIEPEPPRCERGILPLDYAPENRITAAGN